MPVVCRDACGCGQSDEPFEAKVDAEGFCGRYPCWQCRVGAEAPSAVGKPTEAGSQAVGLVFGLTGKLFSEFGEDIGRAC